jgi:hypothetical protein
MTTNEYLQIEATMRGITVEELMNEYRGTETDLGKAVQAADVEWVRDFAEFCMRMQAQMEILH